ncbi:hypothetical protein HNQ96_004336 [Aminobacter lissarensis]|uniref:Uncharacterized protein n=1 Tax=Aminobacter carboxidus TaxID=376165 RepID=A0A8E1WH59_9HYPH|nr:hypothetical protein [Aminobacter lissarensis]
MDLQIGSTKGDLPAALRRDGKARGNRIEAAGQQTRDQGAEFGDPDIDLLDAKFGKGSL